MLGDGEPRFRSALIKTKAGKLYDYPLRVGQSTIEFKDAGEVKIADIVSVMFSPEWVWSRLTAEKLLDWPTTRIPHELPKTGSKNENRGPKAFLFQFLKIERNLRRKADKAAERAIKESSRDYFRAIAK